MMADNGMDNVGSKVLHNEYIGEKRIIEIVVTHHARTRWEDRIANEKTSFHDIAAFLWYKMKANSIRNYYKNEEDVYLIDEDVVMVAEFVPADNEHHRPFEKTAYKMIVVTFLGRMSETMELRDLRSYYSWLRHSRRMTLIKNSRKRK